MRFINKHKASLQKICTTYLLPMLLCFSVMRIIISTYFSDYVATFSALSVVFMGALIYVYELIKPKKIIRGIIFLLIGAVVLVVCRFLLSSGFDHSGVWFMNWFYVSNQEAGIVNEYSAVVFIFFSFFLASIVYYFSVIRFRASGLMLAVLLPFIIYGKRAMAINDFDMVFMVTVYLGLVLHGKLSSDDVKKDTIFNYSYVIAGIVFVTFVGMVTMFIPKPDVRSYLENNRNFFDLRVNSDLNAFSTLNSESSARFGQGATGELLFRMRTNAPDDVIYLRRQTFDKFVNERWVTDADISRELESFGMATMNPIGSNKNYSRLMQTIASMTDFKDTKSVQTFEYFKTANDFSDSALRYIRLDYEESFRPGYIAAELNIDPSSRQNSITIYKTTHSEAYQTASGTYNSITYQYHRQSDDLVKYARGQSITTAEFVKMLDEAKAQNTISAQDHSAITETIEMYTSPDYYVISDRLAQLAKDITAGQSSDYAKAEAIVNYFATGGFTYDMDYMPEDESIDYFMFNSKTGSCTSYATAMTLMARSVGIPARYVEGFAAYEKDDDGEFTVKDTNAHAFVECFIPGAGWMTFDPTVPEYRNVRSSGNASGIIGSIATYLGRAALFLAVGFVLIFIVFLDRIDERLFRIRLHFKPLERKPLMLYQRVLKLLDRSMRVKNLDGYTPQMLTGLVMKELQVDISPVAEMFEKTCFGGIVPTEQEYAQTLEKYKQVWKILAKGRKKEQQNAQKVPKTA